MGTEHVRRLVAGCAVVGVLAAGCSDAEGDPPGAEPSATEQSPTTSATPEETASPGPGPTPWPEPTRPAAMERDDIEGAKAAAEYFLELYPYVYVTGDLSRWDSLSHPDCNFCTSVKDNVGELHSGGGYSDGPKLEISSVEGTPPGEDYEYYSISLNVEEGPHAYYNSRGEVTERYERALVEVDLALMRADGDWLVRGATVREGEGEV